jgi:hypothetical protein
MMIGSCLISRYEGLYANCWHLIITTAQVPSFCCRPLRLRLGRLLRPWRVPWSLLPAVPILSSGLVEGGRGVSLS